MGKSATKRIKSRIRNKISSKKTRRKKTCRKKNYIIKHKQKGGNLDPILPLAGITVIGGIVYYLNKNQNIDKDKDKDINKNQNIDKDIEEAINLKKISDENAQKIMTTFFLNLLKKDENIDIEKAILEFENSNDKSLEEFANKKGRTKDSYILLMKPAFELAKKNLNKSN